MHEAATSGRVEGPMMSFNTIASRKDDHAEGSQQHIRIKSKKGNSPYPRGRRTEDG